MPMKQHTSSVSLFTGDPLRFHAHFIALCVGMDTATPLCDVLAMARLGSNVKKTVVLCSPRGAQEQQSLDDDREGKNDGAAACVEEEDVVYTSLQWSGMI